MCLLPDHRDPGVITIHGFRSKGFACAHWLCISLHDSKAYNRKRLLDNFKNLL